MIVSFYRNISCRWILNMRMTLSKYLLSDNTWCDPSNTSNNKTITRMSRMLTYRINTQTLEHKNKLIKRRMIKNMWKASKLEKQMNLHTLLYDFIYPTKQLRGKFWLGRWTNHDYPVVYLWSSLTDHEIITWILLYWTHLHDKSLDYWSKQSQQWNSLDINFKIIICY